MFAFGLALLLAGAPEVDGNRLRPADRCSELLLNGQPVGLSRTVIQRVDREDGPAWDIVIHQSVPGRGFDMRDHFVLHANDLRPILFDNRRAGTQHVRLAYADTAITGTRTDKGATVSISIVTPEPVWEGNLYGPLFAALPLRAGGSYTIPYYQYDKGIGRFVVAVSGSEPVATPDGPVEAWVLDIDTGGPVHATYLVAKSDGTELGTRAGRFTSRLGGDCAALD